MVRDRSGLGKVITVNKRHFHIHKHDLHSPHNGCNSQGSWTVIIPVQRVPGHCRWSLRLITYYLYWARGSPGGVTVVKSFSQQESFGLSGVGKSGRTGFDEHLDGTDKSTCRPQTSWAPPSMLDWQVKFLKRGGGCHSRDGGKIKTRLSQITALIFDSACGLPTT